VPLVLADAFGAMVVDIFVLGRIVPPFTGRIYQVVGFGHESDEKVLFQLRRGLDTSGKGLGVHCWGHTR